MTTTSDVLKWRWVPHDQHVWVPGRPIRTTAKTVLFQVQVPPPPPQQRQQQEHSQQQLQTIELPRHHANPDDLLTVSPMSLQVAPGVHDLVMLDSFDQASLLHEIRKRYVSKQDLIYTAVGSILISCNPYKLLSIYGTEYMYAALDHNTTTATTSSSSSSGQNIKQSDDLSSDGGLPPQQQQQQTTTTTTTAHKDMQVQPGGPHVFRTAAACYKRVLEERASQSVIISGESGAGKTEATKAILQFLSEVAGSKSSAVEQNVLQSNPVLESFGNAKTIRNDNSSRFGKWMEVHFGNSGGGHILSASVTSYLLERSRVTKQSKGEKNYHIFYQLLDGATPEERAVLDLEAATYEFRYLRPAAAVGTPGTGRRRHIGNEDDALDDEEIIDAQQHQQQQMRHKASFRQTRMALRALHFEESDVAQMWRVLAAILHLGNIDFVERGEGSDVVDPKRVAVAARHLQVGAKALANGLCFRAVTIRGSLNMIPLARAQAAAARDALAKALYGHLFSWLTTGINRSLSRESKKNKGRCNSSSAGGQEVNTVSIGILDIFGFEIFRVNEFEQFLINYANEKLQQHFIEHIFKIEQDEYQTEGIAVSQISFEDNIACLNLIEKRNPPGIMSFVNEELALPRGSDEALLDKMHHAFANNETKAGADSKFRQYYEVVRHRPRVFVIQHFAGAVEYVIDGFMTKNADKLPDGLSALCRKSGAPLIKAIFTEISMTDAPKGRNRKSSESSGGSRRRQGGDTVCSRFQKQLTGLMSALRATTPHFIRCIKPNANKAAGEFDSGMVLRQMKYSGLFEAIRIRRGGYPYRRSYASFFDHYKTCLPKALRARVSGFKDARKRCEALVNELERVTRSHDSMAELIVNRITFGNSKIFLKTADIDVLNQRREMMLGTVLVVIQSAVRGWLARRRLRNLKEFYKRCVDAVEQGADATVIHTLVEEADAHDYELNIVKKLVAIRDHKAAETEVLLSLSDAIEVGDVSNVRNAVTSARMHERETSRFGLVSSAAFDKALVSGNALLDALELRESATTALQTEVNDATTVSNLEAAILRAREAGLRVGDGDAAAVALQDAMTLLQVLREEEETLTLLYTAIEKNSGFATVYDAYIACRELIAASTAERRQVLAHAKKILYHDLSQQLHAFVASASRKGGLLSVQEVSAINDELVPRLQKIPDFVHLEERAVVLLNEASEREAVAARRQKEHLQGVGIDMRARANEDASLERKYAAIRKVVDMRILTSNATVCSSPRVVASDAIRDVDSDGDEIPPPPPMDIAEYDDDDVPPPPPPPSASDEMDSQLRSAMKARVLESLVKLLKRCRKEGFRTRTVRVALAFALKLKQEALAIEKLENAVEILDLDAMKSELNAVGELGVPRSRFLDHVRYLCYGISKKEFVRMQVAYALKAGQAKRLKSLMTEVDLLLLEGDDIEAARDFVALRLGATDWNSEMRRIRAEAASTSSSRCISSVLSVNEAAAAEQYQSFISVKGQCPLIRFPLLRPEADYTKKRVFGKKVLKSKRLVWQLEDMPRSLVQLNTKYCGGDSAEASRVKQIAMRVFRMVRQYMGDSFHNYPVTCAYEIVNLGLREPLLRDEIFCQLIKQTTLNPSDESLILGFKLLYLCISTFAPSKRMAPHVLSHLAEFASPEIRGGLASVAGLATSSYLAYRRILALPSSTKREAPSMMDCEVLTTVNANTSTATQRSTLGVSSVQTPLRSAPPPTPGRKNGRHFQSHHAGSSRPHAANVNRHVDGHGTEKSSSEKSVCATVVSTLESPKSAPSPLSAANSGF